MNFKFYMLALLPALLVTCLAHGWQASAQPNCPSGNKAAAPKSLMQIRNSSRRSALTAGTQTLTGSLYDTGCYAPKSDGGWGFCGPLSCKDAYITCPSEGGGPATVSGVTGSYVNLGGTQYSESNCGGFLARTTDSDKTNWNPSGKCDSTCTQQTTGVCSASFLAKVLVGTGVKYAFCNDKWLVVSSSGEPSVFTPNLNDVPFPPGKSGTTFRTGMATPDTTRSDVLYFPLSVTDLSTSSGTNNQNVFDVQSGAGKYSYLIDGSNVFGVPSDDGIAMAVNGQAMFPIYNNNAQYTPEKCEVDSCSNHVGQGGGQPHFHGDPFGDQDASGESPDYCLYGPSNYSSGASGHPPVIGFAYDGHLIYGRYLSESAPGFAAPLLDACGGHGHSAAGTDEHGFDLTQYHYHTQVFDATCASGAMCAAGDTYKASTTGPFQCFKADLTQSEGSSALLTATQNSSYKGQNDMGYRCCGMTDYYVLHGVDLSADVASSSTCTSPAAPQNGAYAADSACATAGATLYSGNKCTPTCNSGYVVSGTTRCVKGAVTETASCVLNNSSPSPSPIPSPSPTPTPAVPAPSPSPTPSSSSVALCATGSGTNGKKCPPDTTNGPCPPGCELSA